MTHSCRQWRLIAGAAFGTLVLALAATTPLSPTRANASSTRHPLSATTGAALSDTSLGVNTVIDDIHMVDASLGYAVVGTEWGTRFALARTTNDAQSWTLGAPLPLKSYAQALPGSGASLNFVNERVGYLSTFHGPLYVTTNSGTTWRRVRTPGIWPTIAMWGSNVFVASDLCHVPLPTYGALTCPSSLTTFALGATTPLDSTLIPALGPGASYRAASVLAATSPTSVVVVEGAGEGSGSSLLLTIDSGRHWRLAANPCAGLIPEQLLATSATQSLLYCFLDGGMSQGTSELWRATTPSLDSWQLMSKSTPLSGAPRSIGDFGATLYQSKDHTVLFGVRDGASNGLEVSRDGGRQWTNVSLAHMNDGGAPSFLTTFSAKGALFGVEGAVQFRSLDATTWRQLPTLAAGPYHHLFICTQRAGTSVRVAHVMTGRPASTLNYPLVFTNRGKRACYLNGFPAVQPIDGPSRRPVDAPPLVSNTGHRGGFVVLKPGGGTASVVFASQSTRRYSTTYCGPALMTGLDISFAPPANFYVAIAPRTLCRQLATTYSGGVARGVVTWLI